MPALDIEQSKRQQRSPYERDQTRRENKATSNTTPVGRSAAALPGSCIGITGHELPPWLS